MKHIDDYFDQAKKLLPQGLIWAAARSGRLGDVLMTTAGQLSGCHERADNLMMEACPPTSLELLSEWEKFAGLPDECTAGEAVTLEERRRAVVAKLTGRPTLSVESFYWLAGLLGYEITIREYVPFTCGRSRCGGPHVLASGRGSLICGLSRCGAPAPYGGYYARYFWKVIVHGFRAHWFRTGRNRCGERLGWQTPAKDLECFLRRRKPAHTIIIFEYREDI